MNFHGNKIPKENECYTCLSVILIDFIFINSNEKYYPQIFLEECEYAVKNKKVMNTANAESKLDEIDNDNDESDEENCFNTERQVYK